MHSTESEGAAGSERRPHEMIVPGGKNIAMPVIALVAANRMNSVLMNVPRISDIEVLLGVLVRMGAKVEWTGVNALRLDATQISTDVVLIPADTPDFRGAVYLCAVGLSCRRGSYELTVGGDKISGRTLLPHARAIRAFGHKAQLPSGNTIRFSPCQYQRGLKIILEDKGISATCLALILAVVQGKTVEIKRASLEHEVSDFIEIVRKMGIGVHRKGRDITVKPFKLIERSSLFSATVPSDVVAAGTAIVSSLIRRIPIQLQLVGQTKRGKWIASLASGCGGDIDFDGKDTINVTGGTKKGFAIKTGFPPFLPADLQPIFTVLALSCPGSSSIEDTVYADRFDHVACLRSIGADIERRSRTLKIESSTLSGTVTLGRLGIRERAAMRIAELSNDIEVNHTGLDVIWRGYERNTELTRIMFALP